MSNNGKNGPPPPKLDLGPDNIAHQITVVMTKDGGLAILGDIDNIPLMLRLLSAGVDIVGGLVSQKLPQRIIPVTGPLPSGTIPFGRARG